MNQDAPVGNKPSEFDELVDRACREFEFAFGRDPGFRIEQLLNSVPKFLDDIQALSRREAAQRAITAELIFVEMDMRRAAGQSYGADEYLSRFPEYGRAVRESLARQQKIVTQSRQSSHSMTADGQSGADDDDFEMQLQVEPPREVFVPRELGQYRDIVEIKAGGFGIVCRAVDRRDGRVVALKFPRHDNWSSPVQRKALMAEAHKAMLLDHPGIVRTYSIENSNGYLAIVQQFIDGSDLKASINQPRSQPEIARLIESIAGAMAHAHSQGIYHRDLKPSNILLDSQGHPFVTDFGLALHEREQIKSPKQRCGTAQYMPPEQAAGLTRLLDGRSDIWSLGVIFYELLTRRRPFEGVTVADVFEQIENKDPRPPRQIDPSIDRELQRICLKCLERQQRDRYPTADELAEDLRHWAQRTDATPQAVDKSSQIIPKGLRSYSAEDASYFLDLLPGPRDRDGVPGSIRFWKSRIVEPISPENRVPVGVIFGPSGSGKSSFVKAGLLPQLGSEVLTVYIEATQADTEVRLLKSLRQRLIGVPADVSLPQLLHGVSEGSWRPTGIRKVLIVIDQFEQRLSQLGDSEPSQLARALRYCDGQLLQCLLLTRDDFLMALSRFADALELDVREGENAQAIDLFDKRHARKVLANLGRAYGRLPAEPAALSEEQELFLAEAVDQLADHDQVICVHLALFAEMFREREWTPGELRQVGGVAGTGERFLEATFGPSSRHKLFRMQRDAAQRVLETLLPSAGTDIRGAMKLERDLIAAAKLQNQSEQFGELIKSLDGKLKLITRTDPDQPHEVDSKGFSPASSQAWYQLTHDYLVPSVRSWLDNTLGMTRAGRARLRLRNLGAQAVPGQLPSALPTNLEWLTWQFQIPKHGLSDNEQAVFRAAGRRFWRQAGLAACILVLLGSVIGYAFYQNVVRQRVIGIEGFVDDLIHQEVARAPDIVNRLRDHQSIAEPILRAIIADTSRPPRDHFRAAMGLLPFDSSISSNLIEAITRPDCTPDEMASTIAIFRQCDFSDHQRLTDVLTSQSSPPGSRFRALCADVLLRQGNGQWSDYAGLCANALWDEPLTSVDAWIGLLQPAGPQFERTLREIFMDSTDLSKSVVLAQALFQFARPPERMTNLAQLLRSANESQFDAILSTIEDLGRDEELATVLEELYATVNDGTGQTNLAIALARLRHDERVAELFAGGFELPATILAINFCTNRRLRLDGLRQLYDKYAIARFENVNRRRAVLQAMALQSFDVFDPALRDWLVNTARYHAENDPDACCFSTAELILLRLASDLADVRQARRNKPESKDGVLGNVLIDALGQAFSIVELTGHDGQTKMLAVATTETTYGDINRFRQAIQAEALPQKPNHPFELQGVHDFRMVYVYCNWLSTENGLPGELCYPVEIDFNKLAETGADLQHVGYRLPTVEEWAEANKSIRVLEGLRANSGPLVLNYAWVFENSRNQVNDVASLLPNAAGLFDSFGNVQEICQTHEGESLVFYEMGQSVRHEAAVLSIDKGKWPHRVNSPVKTDQGFRVVRRLR